ncbi:amino acid transporter [Actinoalloteichus sp. AHMU CJ021]|uniref:nucleotidyltransferase domain-containing protein n=1 Tax=Actinoalloteichus TaxID=65496 RepID=UPI0004AB84C1|nr:hypothetical protein [Actinoalloteichus caeruleus]AUS80454.1 amino acid transporter [Actinoalloteichus sp. AHMU CJ021]
MIAEDDLGRWDPLGVPEVAALLAEVAAPWWVAGGHAVELAVGRPVRAHSDVDVVVLRPDVAAFRLALADWELWAADPPGTLRRWEPGEPLPTRVHDIWCRPTASAPWRLQLMVDERVGGEWVSRRDPRVRRPVAGLGWRTATGVPVLAPEVQLYYKAAAPRHRDEIDFAAVLPRLDEGRRTWLRNHLGADHPWRTRLDDEGPSPRRG